MLRLQAVRVILHARAAAAHELLAVIAKRLREVVRDWEVQRALLGMGVERLQPRAPRRVAVGPGARLVQVAVQSGEWRPQRRVAR